MGKILIIEDSLTQAEKLRFILEMTGFDTLVARDGQSGYDLAVKENPMLVLTDVLMPKMDGYQLCKKLKSNKQTSHIPVILLTSLSGKDDLLKAIESGANSFISKPYKDEFIVSQINKVIDKISLDDVNEEEIKVELKFPGSENRSILVNPQQVLNLMVSTYDAAIQRNKELIETQSELKNINEHLEDLVEERTKELSLEVSTRIQIQEELDKKNYELEAINTEKDKLLSIIAHDLRSPIGGFLNLTSVLCESAENTPKKKIIDYLHRINKSAKNIYDLLNNLLEWSNLKSKSITFSPYNIDIKSIAEKSLDLLQETAEQKKIIINNNIDEDLFVYVDIKMTETVLRNLISNALKFTERDGIINIDAKILGEYIEISVKDNGIGIQPDRIPKLFSINKDIGTKGTEGEPSTGLGLVLCKEFAERNGGKLLVKSKPNEGSTFSFTVPKAKKTSNRVPKVRSENIEVNDKKLKILIAEDDNASQVFLKIITRNHSNDVLMVDDGLKAINTTFDNEDIDVILMDIKMPIMDGAEAAKKIREFNKDVVIIAQSAYSEYSDSDVLKEHGFNYFISKPVSRDKLGTILDNLVKKEKKK